MFEHLDNQWINRIDCALGQSIYMYTKLLMGRSNAHADMRTHSVEGGGCTDCA